MRHIYEAILISLISIKDNKLRSFLTLLGIMIGVTTIIFIHSVMKGTEKYIVGQLATLGSNSVYISKYTWMENNWREERKRDPITIEMADFIRKNSELSEYVTPLINSMGNAKYGSNEVNGINVIGCNEEYEYTSDATPDNGRFFNYSEGQRNSNVAVIGSEVSSLLFEDGDPIGKLIKINGRQYLVIGVLPKKGEIFGNSLDNQIIIPVGSLKKYFFWNRKHGIDIQVTAKDPMKINQTKAELTSLMRIARGLKPEEENDFSVNEIKQILDFLKKVTASLRIMIIAIGALSLLVGGIGIMNVMLVSVTQRTREIGTRKAIGATSRLIMFQFTTESVILRMVGGILGTAAGFAAAKIIGSFTPLPSTVSFSSVLIGVGFSALVGIVFGYFPAKKAAKLNPIDALRYE